MQTLFTSAGTFVVAWAFWGVAALRRFSLPWMSVVLFLTTAATVLAFLGR